MPKTVTKRTPRTGKAAAPKAAEAAKKTPYTKMTAAERSRVRKEEIAATLRRRDEAAVALSERQAAMSKEALARLNAPKPPSAGARIASTALRIAKKNKVLGGLIVAGGALAYGADKVREATPVAAPKPAKPASTAKPAQQQQPSKDKKKRGLGRPV